MAIFGVFDVGLSSKQGQTAILAWGRKGAWGPPAPLGWRTGSGYGYEGSVLLPLIIMRYRAHKIEIDNGFWSQKCHGMISPKHIWNTVILDIVRNYRYLDREI